MKAFLSFVGRDWTLTLATSVAVQSSMVIAFGWLLSHGVMRRRPAPRHACWLATLFLILLIPVQTVLIPHVKLVANAFSIADQPPSSRGPQLMAAAVGSTAATDTASVHERPTFASGDAEAAQEVGQHFATFTGRPTKYPLLRPSRLGLLVARVWLLGVAVGVVRFLHGVFVVQALRRDSTPVDPGRIEDALRQVRYVLGLRQLPAIHQSRDVTVPVTVGVRRPTVILPSRILAEEQDRLRHVLLHECAHIVRRDAWVGVLQRLARILYWWQPLAYLLLQQLNRAREELCDNVVLRDSSRQDYAATLVALAASCRRAPSFPLASSLFLPRWRLEDRIANLLDVRRDTATRASHWLAALLLVVFGFLGVVLAVGVQAATPQQMATRRSRVTFAADDQASQSVSAKCFPSTASSYLAVMNVPQLVSGRDRLGSANSTEDEFAGQLAELVSDYFGHPVADLETQFGVAFRHVLRDTTGEVGICRWPADQQETALALVADIGQQQEINQLLDLIDQRFRQPGWTRRMQDIDGVVVTLHQTTTPTKKELAHFVFHDLLCLTTQAAAARPMLDRLRDRLSDGLVTQPEFVQTVTQTESPIATEPHLRWYRQPGKDIYSVSRARRRRGVSLPNILDRRLSETLRAAGGVVSFPADGRRAVWHRSVILSEELPEFLQKGLQFPNEPQSEPELWVPADIASYVSFHWNIPDALPLVGSVIDEIVDSEQFTHDVLESIHSDPNGPQVDLERALIRLLGPRVSMASAIGGDPHSWVIAIELQDAGAVARTMDRIWERDPQAKRHEEAGLVVYELLQAEADSPDISLDSRASWRVSAICVAHGQLLVASRFEDLRRLVAEEPTPAPLRNSRVYRRLSRQLQSISPGGSSFQFFSMRGDELTPPYSFLAHRLAAATGQALLQRGVFLSRGLYSQLGETTVSVRTTNDGWIAEGCSLSRDLSPER